MSASKEIVEKTAQSLVDYYEGLKLSGMVSKSQAAIKNRCKTIAEYLVQQLGVRPERWTMEERNMFLPDMGPVLSYTTKEWYKYNPGWKVRVAHMLEAPALLTDLCDDDDDIPTTSCPFDDMYGRPAAHQVQTYPQIQTFQPLQTVALHPTYGLQTIQLPQVTIYSVVTPTPCCG